MPSYIGYHNIADSGTVTASSATATAANAVDYITADYWQPTGSIAYLTIDYGSDVACDYVGIAGHTLYSTTTTVTVQYSANNADWFDAYTGEVPSLDRVYFKAFTSQSKRYWRLKLTYSGTAPIIGHVSIGARWEVGLNPEGFVRTVNARNNTYSDSINQNGAFVGRTLQRRGYNQSFNLVPITIASMNTNFSAFMNHAETKPFFIQADSSNYPTDNLFCWVTADPIPSRTGHYYESVVIDVNGI